MSDARYRSEDGYYTLCPYCATALTVNVEEARLAQFQSGGTQAVPCNTCGLDVTRDAPVEDDDADGRPKTACRHCKKSIFQEALYCYGCRKWQNPPFERA